MLLFGLAACGGDDGIPDDAVAVVNGEPIKTATFDHVLTVAATTQSQQGGASATTNRPDPPTFTKCIAQKKSAATKPAKGQPNPTDATYKAQCQTEYQGLRDQVMQFLTSSAWIEGEAAERGVKLSDAQVKKELDQQRQQQFPTDKDYEAFLKSGGLTQEDLLYRIKVQDLSTKLQAAASKGGSDKISDAQIAAYYNKNKASFGTLETRNLHIVTMKTAAQAAKAKAALESGQSFNTVAPKYSIDKGTRDRGGLLPRLVRGKLEKPLDDAVFTAKKGEVTGPLKTPSGYFVFVVSKITPGSQQSLEQSKAAIKKQLAGQQQQTRLAAFSAAFPKKWKARTECRKGYQSDNCKNAPKKTATAPATAAQPSKAQNPPPANGTTTSK